MGEGEKAEALASERLRMDPALWEMLEKVEEEEEVAALMRLYPGAPVPVGVRPVARFGEVVSCRLLREDIRRVHSAKGVVSLKAPRPLGQEPILDDEPVEVYPVGGPAFAPRHPKIPETGRGVIVGVVDWGCDFTHPNLRDAAGRTRLIALWDQRPGANTDESPYGRGRIHLREAIDAALKTQSPFEALGYHPTNGADYGAHGTHVLDIAAGSGAVGPSGVAPGADMVFVHLAATEDDPQATFGDSVVVVEAVHFIINLAADRRCVINISMGRHGGPHDGSTLVERAFEAAVTERAGRAIVQSTGNYREEAIHAAATLRPGERRALLWHIFDEDTTGNELELWYSGRDRFEITLVTPSGERTGPVPLGKVAVVKAQGEEVGRAYHRAHDPNNGDHHVDVFLDRQAPKGLWRLEVAAVDIVDGRFHAWIERDSGPGRNQSRFSEGDVDSSTTIGTIANGFHTIAVGAYDPAQEPPAIAGFSSKGPTREGRQKPDLVAPGVRQIAARSRVNAEGALLTSKSGTSMAAPHVTGTVALMLEANPDLSVQDIRRFLLGTATLPANGTESTRVGSGFLNTIAAVQQARSISVTEAIQSPAEYVPPRQTRVALDRVQYLAFEGGGGKGFAFLGAVRALESDALGRKLRFQNHRITGDIRGIAGASAGALTAVALASGYSGAEIEAMMVPGGAQYFNFNRFFDLPRMPRRVPRLGGCMDDADESRLVVLVRRYVLPALRHGLRGLPGVDGLITNLVTSLLRHLFEIGSGPGADATLLQKLAALQPMYVKNLFLDFGMFSGCQARDYFDGLISRNAALIRGGSASTYRNLTFARHHEIFGVKLALTGTNLETKLSEIFSVDTTPRLPVADAARISMSLPFIFKPVLIRDARSAGNGENPPRPLLPDRHLLGTWVDGGLLNNLPVAAFDNEPGPNPKTFGVRLGEEARRADPIDSLTEFALRYVDLVWMGTGESRQSTTHGLHGRSAQLDVNGLSLVDFNPGRDVIQQVAEAATRETLRYFGH